MQSIKSSESNQSNEFNEFNEYKKKFDLIRLKYTDNKILHEFSDIYIDEFFMYNVLLEGVNLDIIPSVEIYLIYKKLLDINNQEFNQAFNNINNKINSINNIDIFDKEYFKLKNIIKKIFCHDLLSSPIKKLNLRVSFNSNNYTITIYNTNTCKDIILQLEEHLPFNFNKIALKYNNKNLNNNFNIDFYNIKNNDTIMAYTIQSS